MADMAVLERYLEHYPMRTKSAGIPATHHRDCIDPMRQRLIQAADRRCWAWGRSWRTAEAGAP